MSSTRIIVRVFMTFLITLLVCLVPVAAFLIIVSPGRPKPLSNENRQAGKNGICEKIFVKIGGVTQGMFLRGKDLNNPVLLFVHGGPSFSEYFLVEKYPTGLEDHFTVCYWEERGGGVSYTPEVTMESMTLEQLASDAVEITNYLRDRFKKEKIYIMAHSGGTAFAIQVAAKYPQLFYSYIGISQITNQKESEKLAYRYMIEQYKAVGNSRVLTDFNKFPILDDDSLILPFFNSVLRDKSMHELGIGTMHEMRSIMTGVFYPV